MEEDRGLSRIRATLPKDFDMEGNCVDDEYQNEELLHTHTSHVDMQA